MGLSTVKAGSRGWLSRPGPVRPAIVILPGGPGSPPSPHPLNGQSSGEAMIGAGRFPDRGVHLPPPVSDRLGKRRIDGAAGLPFGRAPLGEVGVAEDVVAIDLGDDHLFGEGQGHCVNLPTSDDEGFGLIAPAARIQRLVEGMMTASKTYDIGVRSGMMTAPQIPRNFIAKSNFEAVDDFV